MSEFDYEKLFKDQIKNESAKLAFFMNEKPNFKGTQLKEILFSNTAGISMRMSTFLFHLTEEVVGDLITAGIPQHLRKFYEEMLYPPVYEELAEPQVLRIEDLRYGFTIWLISCGFAVAGFIYELINQHFLRKVKFWMQEVLGLFLFMKLLRNYLKVVR